MDEAFKDTDDLYNQLSVIAKDIASRYTSEVDEIIEYASDHVNDMNNDQVRALLTDLSFKAYSIGEAREFSSLKRECSESILKEVQAVSFNSSEGTIDVRKNTALLKSSNESLTNIIYETVAGLLKVKLDECHRIVDALKTVILTRNTESKLNMTINDTREEM